MASVEDEIEGALEATVRLAVCDFALELLVELGLAVGTVLGYLRHANVAIEGWGGGKDSYLRANNSDVKRALDLANAALPRTLSRRRPGVRISAMRRGATPERHMPPHSFGDPQGLYNLGD